MTITVNGPDGATYNFPDETPEAEMNAAMAQVYPAPAPQPSVAPPEGNPVIGALKGASRALEANLPFVDRAVAAAKPGDYATNLATEQAKNAQFAQQNPVTNFVGGVAASAPLVPLAGPTFGLGGMTGSMASLAGPSALAGALQGASSSPDLTNASDTAQRAALGGTIGGVLGGAAPVVASGIGKAISPFAVNPDRQALVEMLQQSGIRPTAGQVTGSKGLQKLEAAASDIPLGAEGPREANSRAFTAALMEKAGAEPGQIATPENLDALHEALGDQFDALGARNSIEIDPQLRAEINKAVSDYHDVSGTPAPGVAKTATGLLNEPAAVEEEIPFDVPQSGPARPSGPAPVSMLDFLRRGGGLQDEGGDLKSMGFDNLSGFAAKGSSKIIDKENGRPMDEGLRAAVEAGYMEPHETVSDFINKLGEHPTYSVHDQEAIAARGARDAADLEEPRDYLGSGPGESDMFPGDVPNVAKISGEKYNNVRSQLGKQAQALRLSDPAQAQAYRDMQSALDDAMERSIAGNNPGDAGAFRALRAKYGNLASLEKARASAGGDAALGILSPAQMRTVLGSGNNRRSYARGIGDMTPLTNAGNAILTNFPQSGTTPRMLAAHMLGALAPHAIGGGVGYYEGGLPGAAVGGLVPIAASRALMSRPVQSLLANQLMRGPLPKAAANRAALAAALAARQQLPPQRNTAQ